MQSESGMVFVTKNVVNNEQSQVNPSDKSGLGELNETTPIFKKFLKLLDWVNFVVLNLMIVMIVLWFTVGGFRKVDGVSMYPYFHNRDIVLLYKLAYRSQFPKRGDIIVFTLEDIKGHFVKRVIALPGEEVMIKGGNVYVNGELLDESAYLPDYVYTQAGRFLKEGMPYVVPDGYIIAFGDNRPNSTDSRYWGPIPMGRIEGRVMAVVYPFSRAKWIHNPFVTTGNTSHAERVYSMFLY